MILQPGAKSVPGYKLKVSILESYEFKLKQERNMKIYNFDVVKDSETNVSYRIIDSGIDIVTTPNISNVKNILEQRLLLKAVQYAQMLRNKVIKDIEADAKFDRNLKTSKVHAPRLPKCGYIQWGDVQCCEEEPHRSYMLCTVGFMEPYTVDVTHHNFQGRVNISEVNFLVEILL